MASVPKTAAVPAGLTPAAANLTAIPDQKTDSNELGANKDIIPGFYVLDNLGYVFVEVDKTWHVYAVYNAATDTIRMLSDDEKANALKLDFRVCNQQDELKLNWEKISQSLEKRKGIKTSVSNGIPMPTVQPISQNGFGIPSGFPGVPSGLPGVPSGLPTISALPQGFPQIPSGMPMLPQGMTPIQNGMPQVFPTGFPSGMPAMPMGVTLPSGAFPNFNANPAFKIPGT